MLQTPTFAVKLKSSGSECFRLVFVEVKRTYFLKGLVVLKEATTSEDY